MPKEAPTPTSIRTFSSLLSGPVTLPRTGTRSASHFLGLWVGQRQWTEEQRGGEASAFSRSSGELVLCGEGWRSCPVPA